MRRVGLGVVAPAFRPASWVPLEKKHRHSERSPRPLVSCLPAIRHPHRVGARSWVCSAAPSSQHLGVPRTKKCHSERSPRTEESLFDPRHRKKFLLPRISRRRRSRTRTTTTRPALPTTTGPAPPSFSAPRLHTIFHRLPQLFPLLRRQRILHIQPEIYPRFIHRQTRSADRLQLTIKRRAIRFIRRQQIPQINLLHFQIRSLLNRSLLERRFLLTNLRHLLWRHAHLLLNLRIAQYPRQSKLAPPMSAALKSSASTAPIAAPAFPSHPPRTASSIRIDKSLVATSRPTRSHHRSAGRTRKISRPILRQYRSTTKRQCQRRQSHLHRYPHIPTFPIPSINNKFPPSPQKVPALPTRSIGFSLCSRGST
jgi:hypothetical protein